MFLSHCVMCHCSAITCSPQLHLTIKFKVVSSFHVAEFCHIYCLCCISFVISLICLQICSSMIEPRITSFEVLCHSYVPAVFCRPCLRSANEYGFSSKANDLLPSKQLTSVKYSFLFHYLLLLTQFTLLIYF